MLQRYIGCMEFIESLNVLTVCLIFPVPSAEAFKKRLNAMMDFEHLPLEEI